MERVLRALGDEREVVRGRRWLTGIAGWPEKVDGSAGDFGARPEIRPFDQPAGHRGRDGLRVVQHADVRDTKLEPATERVLAAAFPRQPSPENLRIIQRDSVTHGPKSSSALPLH